MELIRKDDVQPQGIDWLRFFQGLNRLLFTLIFFGLLYIFWEPLRHTFKAWFYVMDSLGMK
jgi:hypothetical protein